MNEDSENPLAQLLASHPEEVDSRLKSASPSKPRQNGLGMRQYSQTFGKNLENEDSADGENPTIVFDGKSDDETSAIGLQVRQPSFVSLHGQIIPKGSDSLADFTPILEEIKPLPIEETSDDSQVSESDDQQVLFVKELKSKNISRWKEMGYEPPSDLIPLVRAASQAMLNRKLLNEEPPLSALASVSQHNFNINVEVKEPVHSLEGVSEEAEEEKKVQEKPTYSKISRPRSGSFGMKSGQAQEQGKLMGMILEEVDEKPVQANYEEEEQNEYEEDFVEEECEEEVYEVDENTEVIERGNTTEVDLENEEEEINENAEKVNAGLPFRLDEVVEDEDHESQLVVSLRNGYIKNDDNTPQLRLKLRHLITVCSNKFMVDETEYINKVLATVEKEEPVSPRTIRDLRSSTIDVKRQMAEEKHEKALENLGEKKQKALQKEVKEYREQTAKLDKKFSDERELSKFAKPSKKLIDLRKQAKHALEQKRYIDAKMYNNQALTLEKADEEKIMKKINDKYIEEDAKLKASFANRRSVIEAKYSYLRTKTDEEYENNLKALENAKKKIALQESITIGRENVKQAKKERIANCEMIVDNNEISSNSIELEPIPGETSIMPKRSKFIETGRLTVRAPILLKRENDIEIIQNMASQLESGKNRNQLDVQAAFMSTKKRKTTK